MYMEIPFETDEHPSWDALYALATSYESSRLPVDHQNPEDAVNGLYGVDGFCDSHKGIGMANQALNFLFEWRCEPINDESQVVHQLVADVFSELARAFPDDSFFLRGLDAVLSLSRLELPQDKPPGAHSEYDLTDEIWREAIDRFPVLGRFSNDVVDDLRNGCSICEDVS